MIKRTDTDGTTDTEMRRVEGFLFTSHAIQSGERLIARLGSLAETNWFGGCGVVSLAAGRCGIKAERDYLYLV